ncbi:hypothetical protein BDR22DRAFT_666304 [Usnea florida]
MRGRASRDSVYMNHQSAKSTSGRAKISTLQHSLHDRQYVSCRAIRSFSSLVFSENLHSDFFFPRKRAGMETPRKEGWEAHWLLVGGADSQETQTTCGVTASDRSGTLARTSLRADAPNHTIITSCAMSFGFAAGDSIAVGNLAYVIRDDRVRGGQSQFFEWKGAGRRPTRRHNDDL